MAIKILSSENISGEVLIASGKYLSWGTAGATSIEGSTVSNKLQFRTNSTNAVIIDSSQNVGIGNFTNPSDGNLVVKKDGLNTGIPNSLTSASFSESGGQLKGLTIGYRTDETTAVIAARTATGDIAFMGYDGGWLETARFTNDNKLGIGTNDPDGKVHIFKGSNGGTTLGTASDELVLENDTDCGLTIRSGADSTGVVSFASPTDHNVGQLYYNHDDDSMVIRTNDAIRTIIGSSGIMYIMGATASTNNSLQLQYNSTAGSAEIYSKSTGGNTTFEFYTSNSGTTTQKFNIGSSGDVKITTNGKFLQGVRNTGSATIDMIGFGAGTDRLQIKGGTSGGAESIAFFDTAGQMATFYNSRFGIGNTTPKFALNTNLAMEGASLAYLDGTSNNQTTTNNIGVTHNASGFGGTNGVQGGLFLANNNNANNAPSPIIFFGARSASNTYNHAYAAIYGVKTGGGADSNWNVGELTFATGDGTGQKRRMTIDKDGDVGIGTDSPGQKLAIEGGGTANENILRVNNQGQVSSRIWLRNAGQSAYIFNSGPTPDTLATGILGQAFGMGINNNSSIQFYNGATASVKMTILPSGNVGIGRTQADEKLEVEGNIKAKDVDGKIYSMVASWSYVASKNDLFSFAGTEGAVWEYTIRMNPNTAGSGAYRDFYYGKLGIGMGWNGSNVTQYMWQQQDQTAPRTLYSSGGGNFNPLFRMYYSGGIYTELAYGTAWTLRIQGLSTTTYGDVFFRRLA